MNNNVPIPAVISAIRSLSADTSLFTIHTESYHPVIASFLPGQFTELSLPGVGEIPISYCSVPSPDNSVELCIRHVGHVTTPLRNTAPGTAIGLRGPFGHGFQLSAYAGQDLILIAGGLGIAPIRSLLLALFMERIKYGLITLLYGAKDASSLLFLDELHDLKLSGKIDLILAIDHPDHSLVNTTDCRIALLPELLDHVTINPSQTSVAICAPPVTYPLLVSALQMMKIPNDRIHLSLERRMKCGIGRCGHCAVGSYLSCCDGPVFSVAQLANIEGAIG